MRPDEFPAASFAEKGAQVKRKRSLRDSSTVLFALSFQRDIAMRYRVICTVISSDRDTNPDIPALLGTSAALTLSGIPFNGPIAAARVGLGEDSYQLNPGYTQLNESLLDMVVAGTSEGVLMVESQARELSEDIMLGGVLYAHGEMQVAIRAIKALAEQCGKPAWALPPEPDLTDLASRVSEHCARRPYPGLPDHREAGAGAQGAGSSYAACGIAWR